MSLGIFIPVLCPDGKTRQMEASTGRSDHTGRIKGSVRVMAPRYDNGCRGTNRSVSGSAHREDGVWVFTPNTLGKNASAFAEKTS
jgi:hypothetical protein